MKQNFTKFTLVLATILISASLYGQRFYGLNVEGQEDPLLALSAGFGPCVEQVSGQLVAAEPNLGCSANPITNGDALNGNIAVIDRGTCDFTEKIKNAQDAGAIAVIICNNQANADQPGGVIVMGGEDETITILGVMVSQTQCINLKASLPLQATIVPPFDLTSDDKVLWGNEPGQGDFAGGLNGWTAATIECNGVPSELETWKWIEDGRLGDDEDEGALSLGVAPGPTFCNGVMGFDSDYLDNAGTIVNEDGSINQNAVGTGPCPAPHIGELTSPLIDISGFNAPGISLEFWQDTRQLNTSRFFIEYSVDGGDFSRIEINEEIQGNEQNDEFKKVVPLPGAEQGSTLIVKFVYAANYYYWMIDDVKLIERAANNLQVNENFYATTPNKRVPKSQVSPIHFLADIQNVGSATQTNTNLNITITNSVTGDVVYSDDLAFGDISADSLAENKLFENAWTPPAEVARYTGIYTVSSDFEDLDPSNNTQTINFQVTEDEFANEDGTGLGNVAIREELKSQIPNWAIGNYFHVPNGEGYKVKSLSLGIGNAAAQAGEPVAIRMFKWTDTEADIDGDNSPEAAGSEREFIAFADYTILGDEEVDDVIYVDEIFTADGDEDPIMLENGGNYLVMLIASSDIGFSAKDDLFQSQLAMNLATTQAGVPRYSAFTGSSDDIFEEQYDLSNFTPSVRMVIEQVETSVQELAAENIIKVNPNPAKDFVNLSMDFIKSFKTVNVTISDVAGRVVLMRNLDNIQNHQMQIDVSQLQSGIFNVNINTEEGIRTEQFIKVD